MPATFAIKIVTPERLVVEATAEEMQIPGQKGYLGILPGHAPLITELAVGAITYRSGSITERVSVAWGFAEILPDKVTILAETAERAEAIDVDRAERAKQRAEERLSKPETSLDVERCQVALQRAETRLKVAGQTAEKK